MTKAERLRVLRAKRKTVGLCVYCGNVARSGKTLCKSCAKKARAAQIRCLENPVRRAEYREKNRISNKKRRDDRIAAGLCPECGVPNHTGMRLCPRCQAMQTENVRRFRERKKRYER